MKIKKKRRNEYKKNCKERKLIFGKDRDLIGNIAPGRQNLEKE